jgi:hypothetical protein
MKVITVVVNNPIFIEIQYNTLKKYMKCEYEFIVFNDAKSFPDYSNGNNIILKEEIIDMCNKLNIKCIYIPNEHHKEKVEASDRTADSMNFILTYQKLNPDKYLFLDSDMFLIDDFHLTKYENYHCAIVLQSRNNFKMNYLWNGLYYFDFHNMTKINLLNWNCLKMCDTGAMTFQWLYSQTKNIPNTDEIRFTNKSFHKDNIYFIKHLWSCSWDENEIPTNLKNNNKLFRFLKEDPRNLNDKFYCEIYDNKFLHYRAGGNWEKKDMKIHIALSEKLRETLL